MLLVPADYEFTLPPPLLRSAFHRYSVATKSEMYLKKLTPEKFPNVKVVDIWTGMALGRV